MEDPALFVAAVVGTFHAFALVLGLVGLGMLVRLSWQGLQRLRRRR